MDALRWLRKNPLFHEADPNAMRILAQQSEVRSCTKKDIVVRAGAQHAAVIFLADGTFTLYRRNQERDITVVLGVLHAPALFGDAELAAGVPWMETVRAEEDSVYLLLPNAAFVTFVRNQPNIIWKLYLDASVRHMVANHSLQSLALYDVKTRIIRAILDRVRREGRVEADVGYLETISIQDLAAAVAVNPRTVNRCLTELKKAKVLEIHRGGAGDCRIFGVAKLRAELPKHFLGLSTSAGEAPDPTNEG